MFKFLFYLENLKFYTFCITKTFNYIFMILNFVPTFSDIFYYKYLNLSRKNQSTFFEKIFIQT